MEQGAEEAEAIVQRIADFVRAAAKTGTAVRSEQQAIYDIDYLMLETNSGASFEQYFRWATPTEIRRVVLALSLVGLSDIAALTEQAIEVAFPPGLPASNEEKHALTNWTKEQELKLGETLYPQLNDNFGRITNVLAAYALRTGAVSGK